MKITISNYKNIKTLTYDLIENKKNFLFGITGSGKSSISQSLDDEELDGSFSYAGPCEIRIDGKQTDNYSIIRFSQEDVDSYIQEHSDEEMQEILIDDDEAFQKKLIKLETKIDGVNIALGVYQKKYEDMSVFCKQMGVTKLNKGDVVSPSSSISKVIASLENTKNSSVFKTICEMDQAYYEWLLKGKVFRKNDTCPYCERNITKKRNRLLDGIDMFDEKASKGVKSQIDNYETISGKEEKTLTTLGALKKIRDSIKLYRLACDDYIKASSFVAELLDLAVSPSSIKSITLRKETKKVFPDLYKAVEHLNKIIEDVRKAFINARKNTTELLRNKLRFINRYLTTFGIPYTVKAQYGKNGLNNYLIRHNDNGEDEDNHDCLSSGEKILLSLIVFVLKARKTDCDLIIFDDPVSSYDDFRRKQIFNLITGCLDKKTVLVLSHDQVFAKYALLGRSASKCGKIQYLENFDGNVKFVDITKDDFGVYSDMIKAKAKDVTNPYLKACLIREIYEGKQSNQYSYLSSILHCSDYGTIDASLNATGTNQIEIIRSIRKHTGVKLSPISNNDYYKNIDTSSMSLFEKALILREYIAQDNGLDKGIKGELDDYIHLNSRLQLGLNPFSFAFCSKNVYQMINDNIKGTIDIKK